MGFVQEFKKFAVKGNMIDMAVGIIIGAAFGKIVASLVDDIIMPPIGLALGGAQFDELAVTLKAADPATGQEAVLWKWGAFVQTAVDFLIIAFAVFMMVRTINAMKSKEEAKPPTPAKEEQLLTEIRDLLREKT